MNIELNGIEIDLNNSVQLRIVQPEHGGGSCNCWGVNRLILKREIDILLLR